MHDIPRVQSFEIWLQPPPDLQATVLSKATLSCLDHSDVFIDVDPLSGPIYGLL